MSTVRYGSTPYKVDKVRYGTVLTSFLLNLYIALIVYILQITVCNVNSNNYLTRKNRSNFGLSLHLCNPQDGIKFSTLVFFPFFLLHVSVL